MAKPQRLIPTYRLTDHALLEMIRRQISEPMTTRGRKYLARIARKFQGKQGQTVLDQIRTVDQARLPRKLSRVENQTQTNVFSGLQEMFSP